MITGIGYPMPAKSGDGGIRTLVPAKTDKLISSQPRYGHFGTSPDSVLYFIRKSDSWQGLGRKNVEKIPKYIFIVKK